jgi:hypothetical protein
VTSPESPHHTHPVTPTAKFAKLIAEQKAYVQRTADQRAAREREKVDATRYHRAAEGSGGEG